MIPENIQIGDKIIGKNYPCFIIAEAGVNHNGNLETAIKMVDEARKRGADAIKFQTYKTENIINKGAPLAKYQKLNEDSYEDQFQMAKSLELSFKDFSYLKEYTEEKNLIFLSSPFDVESAIFLEKIDIAAFKIPSGEIVNPLLLDKIAEFNKPVILSTGMTNLCDIEFGLSRFYKKNMRKIILLHCITSYPAKIKDANLMLIDTLKSTFKHIVGFSDHTLGYLAAVVAVAIGAKVIEKHFTLDKNMRGPDHKASLNPEEFEELVKMIRLTEDSLGSGLKNPIENELEIAKIARKSIFSKKFIRSGDIISEDDLCVKRPGDGIPSKQFETLIGKKAKKDIPKDSMISWDMIEL